MTTEVVNLERAHGTRRTTIVRVRDGALMVQAFSEWVWVGLDGRLRRLPPEIIATFLGGEG